MTVSQVSPPATEIDSLEASLVEYRQQGDILNQAATLSNLSLAYQQQGNWQEAENSIQQSLGLLADYPVTRAREEVYAETNNILGRLYFAKGEFDRALTAWENTVNLYTNLAQPIGVQRGLINQGKAMQELGLFDRACTVLLQATGLKGQLEGVEGISYLDCQAFIEWQTQSEGLNLSSLSPSITQVIGLRRLGDILRPIGEFDLAQTILEQSQQMAQKLGDREQESLTILSLANLERARGDRAKGQQDAAGSLRFSITFCPQLPETGYNQAKEHYQEAIRLYKNAAQLTHSTVQFKAEVNQLSLLLKLNNPVAANPLIQTISQQITPEFIKNQRGIDYSLVNYAQSLACLQQKLSYKSLDNQKTWQFIHDLLSRTIEHSKQRQDWKALAYTSGYLGHLYEQEYQVNSSNPELLKKAKKYTIEGLINAQSGKQDAATIAYQWQWQLGRILKTEKQAGFDISQSNIISTYKAAFNTLQVLRNDLLAFNQEIQYNFRDKVEPVYRELADLLLTPVNNQPISQPNLREARQVIEALQLAELDDFFQNPCTSVNQESIEGLDQKTAILYTIILKDRIETIINLPKQNELEHSSYKIQWEVAQSWLEELQKALGEPNGTNRVQTNSQEIYKWLIKPILSTLQTQQVKILTFVLDSPLRNIPMATLYNEAGHYLIEDYAVSLAPGLQLVDPNVLEREQLQAILAGLTESRFGYAPLRNVSGQLESVSAVIPRESNILLNDNFTQNDFQEQVKSSASPIVHLATHGQFSSQAENTFIVTWDNRINVRELRQFLKGQEQTRQNPIELLVLAACETAQGDKRAALGLAGVAVEAGARSTLATLWKVVADESPNKILTEFYRQLQDPTVSKAEALQAAQLKFINDDRRRNRRPYIWSPYILIGNWL
ncbi:CHAT domain-containing protein [Spirulina sp. CS-785/01]|uniref:CHAT domain-containing protein n=1 Tax=Spirulina sp. CS-785/01 TaxID=3021716 RepID=UPI00232C15DF|nr:CHAT domain-containing protein [Spirulina sp. CS-785/01]MDB9313633.1 CHAT domain-containing protein [Spirulina sp. CS-785/01]